jgi:hypothetical protein
VREGVRAPPQGAPPGTAAAHYHPEVQLTTDGIHGITWKEPDARQRSVNQRTEDLKKGNAPPPHYDQGKFGTLADVNYVVEAARQFLAPEGNATGLPHRGVFELPPGHQNVIFSTRIPQIVPSSTSAPSAASFAP